MGLLDVIKEVGVGAVEASSPVMVSYGTVTQSSPLEINVDQRFTLESDFLVKTEKTKNIEVGDKVILLRVQGGQQYVVLDKVVE